MADHARSDDPAVQRQLDRLAALGVRAHEARQAQEAERLLQRDLGAVDADGAARHVVEAEQEPADGALARARGAHHRDPLPRRDAER